MKSIHVKTFNDNNDDIFYVDLIVDKIAYYYEENGELTIVDTEGKEFFYQSSRTEFEKSVGIERV